MAKYKITMKNGDTYTKWAFWGGKKHKLSGGTMF